MMFRGSRGKRPARDVENGLLKQKPAVKDNNVLETKSKEVILWIDK